MGESFGLFGGPRIVIGKHRIEALADGVFAIVLTLLVLELKLPDLPRHVPAAQLRHALAELVPVLFAYFLTFLLGGIFWSLHQLEMHYVHQVDRAFVWLNLAFLCFVALLPFSCGLFGRFQTVQGVASLYYGNEVIIGTLLLASWIYARRRHLVSDIEPAIEQRMNTRLVFLPSALAGAAVISYWRPELSVLPIFVAVLFVRLRARRQRVAAAKSAAR